MISNKEKILKIKYDLLKDVNYFKQDLLSEGVADKIRGLIKNIKKFKDTVTGDAELNRDSELKGVINDLLSIATLLSEISTKYNKFFKKYGSATATAEERDATNKVRDAIGDITLFIEETIKAINE